MGIKKGIALLLTVFTIVTSVYMSGVCDLFVKAIGEKSTVISEIVPGPWSIPIDPDLLPKKNV
ncbi:MAG: hypothetical protein ACOYVK_15990 [Bacillota bacterium]